MKEYGAYVYGSPAPTSKIADAVKQFGKAYDQCTIYSIAEKNGYVYNEQRAYQVLKIQYEIFCYN